MDQDTLFVEAQAAIVGKRHDDARKILMNLLRVNPRHEEGWLALASIMDEMDKAIDCLNRVLALNPNNATAKEWMAFAEQEKARQAAEAEMAANPAAVQIVEPGDEGRSVPRLGKYLLDYNFIGEDQLKAALVAQRQSMAQGQSKRLGDVLIEQGAITAERLNFAIEEQQKDGDRPVPRLGKYLLDYKFITDEQLKAALTAQRAAAEKGESKRLGDILLEQGSITQERLGFAVREQSRSFFSQFND
jgi:tetratricopeptide (TPR) repeat protein